nr:replication endonuclease [Marinobacterium ramblicola]
MAGGYLLSVRENSYLEANRNLLRIDQRLSIHDLNLSADTDAIKAFSRKQAKACQTVAESNHYSSEAYDWGRDLALRYNLTPPSPKDYQGDTYPCIKRLCNDRWWRRKVIRLQRRTIESIARDLGLVCAQRSAYSSAVTRETRRRQKASSAEYLASTMLENDDGDRFSLQELHDRSVSNPAVRRAELMTRIKGFEMVAQHLGHCGEFYTLTAPSRMHARLKRGGKNPRYDGTTPDQAHQYLTALFRCIRSKLHREGLPAYGLRVVEPNHDGTPHWHLLLFMDPAHCEAVRRIFSSYALRSDPDEKGARKHRFTAKAIDPKRGSAAGYVAKYIAKNIDGEYDGTDITGQDTKSTARAIDAWASTFNIRQFQFIGGPSVTIWRELRRLANSESESASPLLQKAIEAADAAEWAAFVMVMGGPIMRRVLRPIQSLYDAKEVVDLDTGEILHEAVTGYGDPKPPRLIGLVAEASRVITRTKTWTLIPRGTPPQSCGQVDTGARRRPALDLCQ